MNKNAQDFYCFLCWKTLTLSFNHIFGKGITMMINCQRMGIIWLLINGMFWRLEGDRLLNTTIHLSMNFFPFIPWYCWLKVFKLLMLVYMYVFCFKKYRVCPLNKYVNYCNFYLWAYRVPWVETLCLLCGKRVFSFLM